MATKSPYNTSAVNLAAVRVRARFRMLRNKGVNTVDALKSAKEHVNSTAIHCEK